MDEDTERCAILCAEEIEATQSVYGSTVSCQSGPRGATIVELELHIELNGVHTVHLVDDGTVPEFIPARQVDSNQISHPRTKDTPQLQLSHLPPIRVGLILPPTYPLHDTPSITSLHPAHHWISPTLILELKSCLRQIMQEALSDGPEGALWRLIEFVREGAVLQALGMRSNPKDKCLQIPHPTPSRMAPLLLSNNALATTRQFDDESYPCPICLTTVRGSRCTRLEKCGHVCCRSCLNEFWTLSIQQGEVEKVGCVDAHCVKLAAEASDVIWTSVGEEEVRRVVGESLVQRWLSLREKRIIEQDPTIVRCPVQICQAPVPRPALADPDDEDDPDTGWSRLRTCQSCEFSFCLICRKTWSTFPPFYQAYVTLIFDHRHGPIAPCKLSATADMLERYLSEPPNSAERRRLDRQYGKRNIQTMIADYKETKLNKKWLEQNTMACPGCATAVEKSIGCNHMKCARCSIHFCFQCGEKLKADDPYLHFSLKGSPCYGKLFAFTEEENEWQPMIGFELT